MSFSPCPCVDAAHPAGPARRLQVLHLPEVYKPEAEAEAAGWGRGADKLAHLTTATFKPFELAQHPAGGGGGGGGGAGLMLLFHGWGSKAAKPAFAQLSRELPELAAAAVDCGDTTGGKPLCERFGVAEYPQVRKEPALLSALPLVPQVAARHFRTCRETTAPGTN